MLVVIIIVWILLFMTLYLGRDYLRTVQVQTDREYFTSFYSQVLATARTSNYFQSLPYDALYITFSSWSVMAQTNDALILWSYELDYGTLVFSWWVAPEIIVEPYSLGCEIYLWFESTDRVDFTYISALNTSEFCYHIDAATCKMISLWCVD